MTLRSSLINRRTCYKYIVNHCKHTLAADPATILVLDTTVIEDCSLVQVDATAVNDFGKWDLIWMKIFPARFALDLVR